MYKYDITWIMQSYLGEYEGSRANSDKKFIRAVKSFLAIPDERTQLVIASDGCEITHKLYYKHFKKEPRIEYVYVDKNTPKMYEKSKDGSNNQYYRGLPRQAGLPTVMPNSLSTQSTNSEAALLHATADSTATELCAT